MNPVALEIARFVGDSFHAGPADRDELMSFAEERGASNEVLCALSKLPAERAYRSVGEVWADVPGIAGDPP
jgi:hypothetical protein